MNKMTHANHKKWTWRLSRQPICIAIALFMALFPCLMAQGADWSTNVHGVNIECNVENIGTDLLGVWWTFNPKFTCGDPYSRTLFICSRISIGASYECTPLGAAMHNCGNYLVEMRTVKTTINLPAGTQNAQNKVCGDLFPSMQIGVTPK